MKKAVLFKASMFSVLFAILFWCGTASANLNGTLWSSPIGTYVGVTDQGEGYMSNDGYSWAFMRGFKDNGEQFLDVEISLLGLIIVKGPYSIPNKTMNVIDFGLLFWILPLWAKIDFSLEQTNWAGPNLLSVQTRGFEWHRDLIKTRQMQQ